MPNGITDYARANFPQTYDALDAKDASTVAITLERVLGDLFVVGTGEGDLTERAKSYVGDVVAHALIPAGIDHWMNESRLADSVNQESVTYYNRVSGLRLLDQQLAARIAANRGLLAVEVPDLVPGSRAQSGIPKVSSAGTRPWTQDPADMESLNPIEGPGTWI